MYRGRLLRLILALFHHARIEASHFKRPALWQLLSFIMLHQIRHQSSSYSSPHPPRLSTPISHQDYRVKLIPHPSSYTPRGLDLKTKLPRSTLQLLRHPERREDPFKVALKLRRRYRVSPTSLTALLWLRFTWTLIIRIPYSLTYPSQAGD